MHYSYNLPITYTYYIPKPLSGLWWLCVTGRAIRHSNDYATVVLIDHRYSRKSVKENLPKWMTKSLMDANSFGVAYAAVRKVDLGCT